MSSATTRLAAEAAVVAVLMACGGADEARTLPLPPSIAAQPASLTITACGSASFVVRATGSPPLTFRWLEDGAPIPGAIGPSLAIPRAGPAESGRTYSAVVANAVGAVTSQGASLTVIDPGGPLAIAASEGHVVDLAVDGGNVFWSDGAGIYAAAVDCSGPVHIIYQRATQYETISEIALATTHVVWTDYLGGAVRSAPRSGGPATTLASQLGTGQLHDLAFGDGELFWPNHLIHGIQKVALDGGDVTTFAVGDASSISTDDLYIYWTDTPSRTVSRMPLVGGAPMLLASDQGYPGVAVSDGQFVYWTSDAGQPPGYTVRVNREGGTPVVLASEPSEPLYLALDGKYLYWTSQLFGGVGPGSVSRAPLDGSEPPTVLVSGLDSPSRIAVDSRYIYWSETRGLMRLEK